MLGAPGEARALCALKEAEAQELAHKACAPAVYSLRKGNEALPDDWGTDVGALVHDRGLQNQSFR